mgnify:CR=1 FL=1
MSDTISNQEKQNAVPKKLHAIIEELQEAEREERMEYLIDFAMELPDLPERLHSERNQMEQVHECQSPVHLITELHDGKVKFFFDIPREAPTVRGYAAILVEGLEGATAEEVLSLPDDVYMQMNIQDIVTPQRIRGLHFLLLYMKRQVTKLL